MEVYEVAAGCHAAAVVVAEVATEEVVVDHGPLQGDRLLVRHTRFVPLAAMSQNGAEVVVAKGQVAAVSGGLFFRRELLEDLDRLPARVF